MGVNKFCFYIEIEVISYYFGVDDFGIDDAVDGIDSETSSQLA